MELSLHPDMLSGQKIRADCDSMFCLTNDRDMIEHEHVALHVLCEVGDRDTLFRAASVSSLNTRDRIARHSFRYSKSLLDIPCSYR